MELNQDLFGNAFNPFAKVKKGNPCIKAYGLGPEGERCKHCAHLYYKQFAGKYYKCELRDKTDSNPGGAATDHRANWPACAKFIKQENDHV